MAKKKRGNKISTQRGTFILIFVAAIVCVVIIWQTVLSSLEEDVNQTNSQIQSKITVFNKSENAMPEAAVDWKTYTNSKYKFSVQYPASYHIKEQNIADAPNFDLSGQSVFAVDFGKSLSSNLSPDSDNFIDIIVNKNAPKGGGEPNGLDYNPAAVKTVTINSIKMSKLTEDLYVTEKNGVGFFIQDFSNTDKTIKANFDKMVQTFKFTK